MDSGEGLEKDFRFLSLFYLYRRYGKIFIKRIKREKNGEPASAPPRLKIFHRGGPDTCRGKGYAEARNNLV